MRIRRSAPSSVSPSPAPSSCSSSSSCFSSHSTISTHSPTSSSSNSATTSSSATAANATVNRCHGLDLLVKAVYYVAGSVVGVPYIQRRVIRRRKPALRFTNLVINSDQLELTDLVDDDRVIDCTSDLVETTNKKDISKNKKNKKPVKRRSKAVPLKYNDSVLQSWKPSDRRRRRSIKG
ncbi:hypothetical protein SOVF_060530 [Spinacia oleracea]|nr:hypothetical protein SOVF_060530 [Spinacia oleracea]